MGFPPEDIGFGHHEGQAMVALRCGKEDFFNVFFGQFTDLNPHVYVASAQEASQAILSGVHNAGELEDLLEKSQVWSNLEAVTAALIDKGYVK